VARKGKNCTTGCKTKDHLTWGECMRAKNAAIAYCGIAGGDATAQKRWDNELSAYRDARKEGIQPTGTTMPKIEAALRASDKVGAAYGRDFAVATPMEA
jgi:hypothetical protein